MASKNLWAVIARLKTTQVITPRQVRKLLGCSTRKASDLLRYLELKHVVVNIGKPRSPEYRLKHNGELKIQPLPEKTSPARPCIQERKITDICRQNWTGYEIHKIFGSARS